MMNDKLNKLADYYDKKYRKAQMQLPAYQKREAITIDKKYQTYINYLLELFNLGVRLQEDGLFGMQTLKACQHLNERLPAQWEVLEPKDLPKYEQLYKYYTNLYKNNPNANNPTGQANENSASYVQHSQNVGSNKNPFQVSLEVNEELRKLVQQNPNLKSSGIKLNFDGNDFTLVSYDGKTNLDQIFNQATISSPQLSQNLTLFSKNLNKSQTKGAVVTVAPQ